MRCFDWALKLALRKTCACRTRWQPDMRRAEPDSATRHHVPGTPKRRPTRAEWVLIWVPLKGWKGKPSFPRSKNTEKAGKFGAWIWTWRWHGKPPVAKTRKGWKGKPSFPRSKSTEKHGKSEEIWGLDMEMAWKTRWQKHGKSGEIGCQAWKWHGKLGKCTCAHLFPLTGARSPARRLQTGACPALRTGLSCPSASAPPEFPPLHQFPPCTTIVSPLAPREFPPLHHKSFPLCTTRVSPSSAWHQRVRVSPFAPQE